MAFVSIDVHAKHKNSKVHSSLPKALFRAVGKNPYKSIFFALTSGYLVKTFWNARNNSIIKKAHESGGVFHLNLIDDKIFPTFSEIKTEMHALLQKDIFFIKNECIECKDYISKKYFSSDARKGQ